MNDQKKVSIAVVIIFCLNAAIWTIRLIAGLAYGYTDYGRFMVDIFCAIGWIFIAVVWIIRYCKSKKRE